MVRTMNDEYTCKGSWSLGTACGNCAKCVATKPADEAFRAQGTLEHKLAVALEALEKIAFAGMSGSGVETEEDMSRWHARRAWQFIGIAARAVDEVKSTND